MNITCPPRSIGLRSPTSLTCASALIIGIAFTPTASGLAPLQFNLTVLSADLDNSDIPVINGDNVVWIGRVGNERNVYRYNISSGTRSVLNSAAPDPSRPAIDGNYVAWENLPGISLHDLTTGSTLAISTAPYTLTANISGNNVVWLEGRPQDTLYRLMRYNINTHTSQQLLNYTDIHDLRISSNDIVWDGRTGSAPSTSEIFHYSLSTGATTRLTTNSIPDVYPEVSAGNVVWQTFDTEITAEVFRRNLQTGVTERLTNNSERDATPEISGSNVVWQGGGAGGSVNNIFYRNLATGVTSQLTHATVYPEEYGVPHINDANVAWTGKFQVTSDSAEIFFYNVTDGITSQVTNDAFREQDAAVFGSNVAFLRERPRNTNRWDIVLATPVPEPSTFALLFVVAAVFHCASASRRLLRQ